MTGALITTSAALLLFVFSSAILLDQRDRYGARPSMLAAASLGIWLAIIGAGVIGETVVRAVVGS